MLDMASLGRLAGNRACLFCLGGDRSRLGLSGDIIGMGKPLIVQISFLLLLWQSRQLFSSRKISIQIHNRSIA
jgi:hypothetical protein